MSLRSQRSARSAASTSQQQLRHSQYLQRPVTDAEVYQYALRVAVLQHVIASRPPPAPAATAGPGASKAIASNGNDGAAAAPKRDSLRRTVTEAASSTTSSLSWTSLSLGDLFRSGGGSSSSSSGGSPKYPERFVKALEQKIEAISRGTDAGYSDMLLRYTVGAFYGKFKDPKNLRMIKENRKLEDLLMMFIATASEVLRKRCAGDEWKMRLELQVESFVRILEECLRQREVRHVPPELFVKLESMKTKLSANRPPPLTAAASASPDAAPGSEGRPPPQSPGFATREGNSNPTSGINGSASTVNGQAATASRATFHLADMPSARQVGLLFGVDDVQLQRDISALRQICTEKAAMSDLKQCVNLVSINAHFPGCREDFATEEAYKEWRSRELGDLQKAMMAMIQHSPELVHSSDDSGAHAGTGSAPGGSSSRPTSAVVTEAGEAYVGNRLSQPAAGRTPIAEQFATSLNLTPTASNASSVDDTNTGSISNGGSSTPLTDVSSPPDSGAGGSLCTYVPAHDARGAYTRLLGIMLSFDLEEMANLDPSEEVPLRILSRQNLDLLSECVLRWRIGPAQRFVSFFAEMGRRYAEGEMPVIECVLEALGDFEGVDRDLPASKWPEIDHQACLQATSSLFDAFLRSFYETYSEQLPGDSVPPIIDALSYLRENALFDEAVPAQDLSERYEQLRDGIRRVSDFLYARERDQLLASTPEETVVPLLELLGWIKTSAKRLDRHYKAPLLGEVDVPQLFLERVPDLFLQDLSARLRALEAARPPKPLYTTPNDPDRGEEDKAPISDGEVNALYTGVKELTEMHRAFCPNTPLSTSVNSQFEPYISRWIADTDKKTLGWVRSAINLDDFKPDEEHEHDGVGDAEKHSSSIVDLIASCKGAVQFVTDLDWPDEYQNALFLTKLSSTISKSIEQYCIAIEELFMREMTPAKRDSGSERDERTSAWLTRAKALYQEKKLEAFPFKPTSCVKLNNIHAARQLLDKMYTAIDADRVANVARTRAPPLPAKQVGQQQQLSRNLFTIKLVLGEGLATADGVSRVDPFVTLSDERGLRIAKTRTLYETTEPRWAETFDISVEGKMWIAATVWNRNLVDEHELLGRTYLALDPNVYGDFLPHDLWQDLDTVGRLLLRVSMEGEKDDIQFYFGRAFRSLKRAENDMTRIIVDKISPFIRASISQASLKSLLRKGGFSYLTNLNLDKAFDKAKLEGRLEGVRNLMRTKDPNAPEIPLPPSLFNDLRSSTNKPLPAPAGEASKKRAPGLTDAEIEEPLSPLLDYLDQSLETFRKYLSESAWQVVMTKIWKEVLSVTESLLVPALSDQPTEMKPLMDKEVDIVFKWLKFLTNFFYADGGGVPIEDLRNPRYRAVMMIRLYYDWSTDQLMEECVRLTNQQLTAPVASKGVARSKSVYQQRNLGTIRERKREKNEDADSGAAEMVMRILRMRPGALDFLQQQMITMNLVQEKQSKPTRLLGSIRGRGKGKRGGGSGGSNRLSASVNRLPPIPSPELPHQYQQHQQPLGPSQQRRQYR